ncbi:hypothetical protein QJS10_CPA08g00226 [Acorus calamus]|uniref:Uncharacterized protein n=1 Tax=Acorus calamus TaxID=4465 RepID=A0AAV9E9S4_ACOCL|nr:hypothetical protein QJS10_CPA08g00226 [Acorus calamus]
MKGTGGPVGEEGYTMDGDAGPLKSRGMDEPTKEELGLRADGTSTHQRPDTRQLSDDLNGAFTKMDAPHANYLPRPITKETELRLGLPGRGGGEELGKGLATGGKRVYERLLIWS